MINLEMQQKTAKISSTFGSLFFDWLAEMREITPENHKLERELQFAH